MPIRILCLALVLAAGSFAVTTDIQAQNANRRPLSATDIDDIARLVMLEDTRQLDTVDLKRLLGAQHPEVRRRAAQAVGRIDNRAPLANKAGVALLLARPLDSDTAVAATTVFAIGQVHDTSTIGWLDSLLTSPRTPPTVLNEAAIALGKTPVAASRTVLARFLTGAQANARTTPAIGSALLSIGRMPRGDLASIVRWTTSSDEEIRWRATWALFRPRDPAAVATLLTLATDRSAHVRAWAVRGLAKAQADSAQLTDQARSRLLAAARSSDRAEQTEAVNALGTYGDSGAVAALLSVLSSKDSWVAVAAATGLGNLRAPVSVAPLVLATKRDRPCAVRYTAQQALQKFVPGDALAAAMDIARDSVPYCRTVATQALTRSLTAAEVPGAPPRAAVESLLVVLRGPAPAPVPPAAGGGGRAGGGRQGAAAPPARPLSDYRAIVERWIVPAYNGAPNPTSRWETPQGAIELELYPGDAPLAVEDFVRRISSGAIIGTEFTRVVPDFVNQQATIPGGSRIRDEVNRRGLTRANLSWATAGLDTGSPGYTLGHTPQPHNEGNFTPLGRVIRGMDVVDRTELGDRILAARMLTTPPRDP